jgi:hypothetical protein
MLVSVSSIVGIQGQALARQGRFHKGPFCLPAVPVSASTFNEPEMKIRKLIPSGLSRRISRYVCPECLHSSSVFRLSRWRHVPGKPQELGSKIWHRGVKRQTTLTVKARPQGSLPKSVEVMDESDGPVYSTVVQQARNNMRKFAHCVVLTRVGNFYEVRLMHAFVPRVVTDERKLYFEHAEEYGPLLNLKVAQKPTKSNSGAGPISMVNLFMPLPRTFSYPSRLASRTSNLIAS